MTRTYERSVVGWIRHRIEVAGRKVSGVIDAVGRTLGLPRLRRRAAANLSGVTRAANKATTSAQAAAHDTADAIDRAAVQSRKKVREATKAAKETIAPRTSSSRRTTAHAKTGARKSKRTAR